jgi:hypothetical protein
MNINESIKSQRLFNTKVLTCLEIIQDQFKLYLSQNFNEEQLQSIKSGYMGYPEYAIKEVADICVKEVKKKDSSVYINSFRDAVILQVQELKVQFAIHQIEEIFSSFKREANVALVKTMRFITPNVSDLPKRMYSEVARTAENLEYITDQLAIHQENLATAKNSGNKDLIAVFEKEVIKWQAITDIAVTLNYEEIRLDRQANSDPKIAKLLDKNSKDVLLKPYYLSNRKVLDLFLSFNEKIVNSAETVFEMYHAHHITERNTSVSEYIKEIELSIESTEKLYADKFLKNNGMRKSLGYKAGIDEANMKVRIKNLKEEIINLLKHSNRIQSFINSKQPVAA